MKTLIIKIALKMLKKEMQRNPDMTYAELSRYGVQDIMILKTTKEKALIL